MTVELLLNPRAKGYKDLVEDLREELRALKGLQYSEETVPAPPNTLNVEYEIVKYVFHHPNVITLATSVIQLVRAIAEKRNIHPDKENPQAMIVAGDKQLKLPSPPASEKRFVDNLGRKTVKTKMRRKPRRGTARTRRGPAKRAPRKR